MPRPRAPQDPGRWPEPCGRCGEHRQLVVRWPDAHVCNACYLRAKRTRGTCRCGHVGVLPGIIKGAPACRACSGIRMNLDCRTCGREDEIYRDNQCWACVLAAQIDTLLRHPDTGTMNPELVPLADALKAVKRANSGLTWIRQPHVADALAAVAAMPTLSHKAIDSMPDSPTREHIRGLLVEHGVLPARDETRERFEQWAKVALRRVEDPAHRDVIQRYIRWNHLRRMNNVDAVSTGSFLRSKQAVTVAIEFVNWLGGQGTEIGDLQQAHLDAWVVTGPSTRLVADRFLRWAIRSRVVATDLTLPRHRRGTSRRLSAGEQGHAIDRVIGGDTLTARDRAAAVLLLIFAQPVEAIVALTWDDVIITRRKVTLRLAAVVIELPEPLDEPFRRLAAEPGHDQTSAHPHSKWVFRSSSPGRHLTANHLRTRLRRICAPLAARQGTLEEIAKTAPVAVIAETLGYSPATVERHAVDAGASYHAYVAARR